MKNALVVISSLMVAAAIGLPLGQPMRLVALMAVVGGAFALVVSAKEWSGKLFAVGIGLAVFGTFWDGLSFQLHQLAMLALHDPSVVVVLVIMALAALALLLAKAWARGTHAKASTPRARERARLVEPHDGPSRIPSASAPDDLGLFGPRHD